MNFRVKVIIKNSKKFKHNLIRAVVNFEKEGYLPFLETKYMSLSNAIKESISSTDIIFPNQIEKFLDSQNNIRKSFEVKKYIK